MKVIKTEKGDLIIINLGAIIRKFCIKMYVDGIPENHTVISYSDNIHSDHPLTGPITNQQADVLLEKLFILIASRDKTLIRISEWLEE